MKNDNVLENDQITEEYILYEHNIFKNDITKCLNIVKEYILEHELLLVGGMAIDFALKAKNDFLYNNDYQIADYDIISPNNVDHANKLGTIICNSNIKKLSIIPALHKTTVRIQLYGYTLLDATYIPEYIYNKIPSMQFNEFKFIHPIYQKIDQYTSLSLLFEITGPSYNIEHRFKKDINRKDRLDKHYKLQYDKNIKTNLEKIQLDLNIYNPSINKIKIFNQSNILYENTNNSLNDSIDMLNDSDNYYSVDCDVIQHGAIAYALYYRKFKDIVSKALGNNNTDFEQIKIEPNVFIDSYLNIEILENMPLSFINNNDNIDKLAKKINSDANYKKFEGMARSFPNYYLSKLENNKVVILDLYGQLISINHIEIDSHIFIVANYNYILSFFLFNYYMEEDEELKEYYRYYYISLLSMVEVIQHLYINKKIDNLDCFTYSINNAGFVNQTENYFYFVKNYNNLIAENRNLNDLPPKNYIGYPNCEIKKSFDDSISPFYNKFQKELKHTNFAKELDEILTKL